MSTPNIGWLFYKDYFSDLKNSDTPNFTLKSRQLTGQHVPVELAEGTKLSHGFYAQTTYPGMLIGTGYPHITGGEGEFKIGFYFDYTSGLPVIPGSSVKGLLRSAFPCHRKDLGESYRKPRFRYISELVKQINGMELTETQVAQLEKEVFEGIDTRKEPAERIFSYQRDKFHDGVVSTYSTGKKLLAADFITPHKLPLQNPVPIALLKVAQGVIFHFRFELHDSEVIDGLTATHKQALFKQIILDQGVGAKTNVGYGQLDEVDVVAMEKELAAKEEKLRKEKEANELIEKAKKKKEEELRQDRDKRELGKEAKARYQSFEESVPDWLKSGEQGMLVLDGIVYKVDHGYVYIDFDYDGETCLIAKVQSKLKGDAKKVQEIEEGSIVTVTIQADSITEQGTLKCSVTVV